MRLLDRIITRPRADTQWFDPDNLGGLTTFTVGGNTYTVPVNTTMPGQKAEAIPNSFVGFALGGLMGNGVIFGLASIRMKVFSEARFQFQRFNDGRPGELYDDPALDLLKRPWPGGTTGDLEALMLLQADFAGNAYVARINGQLVCMRPDWVDIILGDRRYTDAAGRPGTVGLEKLGYCYYQGGKNSGGGEVTFLADEVAHFAPQPDPLASYRGMSWLTPVLREIMADGAMTSHKLRFFENAATPNLAVNLKEVTDPQKFQQWVDMMDDQHKGSANAYRTLYTGAGADVTVIGTDLGQLDFKAVAGFGETRLAQAAGVPPTVACLSEGMQGSSLNAGNFQSARRQFADITLSNLWRNAAGSLAVLVPAPSPADRLWYDTHDIPFLQEDVKDRAEVLSVYTEAIRQLCDSGFEPDAAIDAVAALDVTLLRGRHSGLYSVQLQKPMTATPPAEPALAMNGAAKSAGLDDAEFLERFAALLRPAPIPARTTVVERDGYGRVTRTVEE